MLILCKITKAASKHSEYIKLTVFLRHHHYSNAHRSYVYTYVTFLVTMYNYYLGALILSYLAIT